MQQEQRLGAKAASINKRWRFSTVNSICWLLLCPRP